jgi:hypothetical protein
MLTRIFGALLICFSLSAFGQDAKVIELQPKDAELAAKLYAKVTEAEKALEAAKKEYEAHRDFVRAAYSVPKVFSADFKFSTNFKFLVPKPESTLFTTAPYYPLSCCTVTTPYLYQQSTPNTLEFKQN